MARVRKDLADLTPIKNLEKSKLDIDAPLNVSVADSSRLINGAQSQNSGRRNSSIDIDSFAFQNLDGMSDSYARSQSGPHS